jgi:hypothetical protein
MALFENPKRSNCRCETTPYCQLATFANWA